MPKLRAVQDKDSQLKFELKAKDKKKKYAELVLYGEIGETWWGDGITAKMVSDSIKEFGEIDDLDVRINSPGGNVFDGVTIYNRLKQLDANVTVYVDGLAASIASIIAMAGDEIILSEGTLFMVHSPMTGVYGNQRDMEETIQLLDTIEEEMITIYAKKSGLPRSEIRSLLHAETWMTSEEAIEKGFGTSVDSETQLAAYSKDFVAKMASVFKNCPVDKIKTRDEEVKNKLGNILSNIEDFQSRK